LQKELLPFGAKHANDIQQISEMQVNLSKKSFAEVISFFKFYQVKFKQLPGALMKVNIILRILESDLKDERSLFN